MLPARILKDEPYNDCRDLAQGICSLAETFEAVTALPLLWCRNVLLDL